ncbi:uncharacterized protein LOC123300960 [Chrysoperla carnea]|uniref:uncharacterized protein LOC123300960 n=1 Tax=Chrysoperla carnea TaxID=189513 RepID=UPI001D088059|nr:uncharacterized protein LOC123300960 [Chrysoperla carnea]
MRILEKNIFIILVTVCVTVIHPLAVIRHETREESKYFPEEIPKIVKRLHRSSRLNKYGEINYVPPCKNCPTTGNQFIGPLSPSIADSFLSRGYGPAQEVESHLSLIKPNTGTGLTEYYSKPTVKPKQENNWAAAHYPNTDLKDTYRTLSGRFHYRNIGNYRQDLHDRHEIANRF